MINDNEVREALGDLPAGSGIPKRYCKAVNTLIDLAEAYLKAGKEMPEKKEIGEMRYGGCNPDFDKGYNQAIDDCTLAYMKREAELLEKIRLLQAEVDVERCADWKGYAKHLEQKQAEWEKKLDEIKEVIKKYVLTIPIAGDWDGTRALYLNNMCVDGLIKLIREHLTGEI